MLYFKNSFDFRHGTIAATFNAGVIRTRNPLREFKEHAKSLISFHGLMQTNAGYCAEMHDSCVIQLNLRVECISDGVKCVNKGFSMLDIFFIVENLAYSRSLVLFIE